MILASLCGKFIEDSSLGFFGHVYGDLWDRSIVMSTMWWSLLSFVGDAGNTSLVDAGTPLGATAVVTPGSAGYLLWECCILASL